VYQIVENPETFKKSPAYGAALEYFDQRACLLAYCRVHIIEAFFAPSSLYTALCPTVLTKHSRTVKIGEKSRNKYTFMTVL
jgi:hypothetical protein